mgnify:CR=1 FL=1
MVNSVQKPTERHWFALAVISSITIAASVNRQLIGLIAEPVRREFNLSDTQIGSMFGIVGIVIALLGPVVGLLVDRVDRHRLIGLSILIWSAATLAYGLSPSYMAIGISLTILATAETTLLSAALGKLDWLVVKDIFVTDFARSGLPSTAGSKMPC